MKKMLMLKLGYLAAASLLSLFTAQLVLAGSVTQPGDTMGVANGASTPEGFYFVNQANWGCSKATPRTCLTAEVPLLVWSTPWKILGGQLLLTTGPTTYVRVDIHDTYHVSGLFNPFVGGKLTWDLGNGWGFGYLLGTYFDINSNVAYSSTSLNQRFALSYTANEWNLTANAIWGINFDQRTNDPQGTPCPGKPEFGCNPNFLNVDLTATKGFGKWEVGAIGFYATDISTPISDYDKQSKAAIGGLVGYSFGPFTLQIYATTEVYENNYGRKDTRIWSRITIPLGNPFGKSRAGGPPPLAVPIAQ